MIPQQLLDATNEFAKNLEWSRRLPIYEIHKWWARRYSGIVRLFLIYSYLDIDELSKVSDYKKFVHNLYFNPPKIDRKSLLDPFCGGGTIILEASKLGFDSYGIEINKLAYLILDSYKELYHLSLYNLKNEVIKFVDEINKKFWTTRCKYGHEAIIIHTFLGWKDKEGKLQIKYNKITDLNNGKSLYYCEKCDILFEDKPDLDQCPYCGNYFNKNFNGPNDYKEIYPYAIEYYCPICKKREIKKADKEDIRNFFHIENLKISRVEIPVLNETIRLVKKGFKYFDELLTPRQKITFFEFLNKFKGTPYEKISKLMVSDSLRSCSLLAYYSTKYKKVTPAFVIKSYWLPVQPVELNPVSYINDGIIRPLGRGNLISSFNKISKVINNNDSYSNNYKIYFGAAQDILNKINKKFDIIFTDPPYADFQYYSDLSIFNLSILGELDEKYLGYLLNKEVVLRDRNDFSSYYSKLSQVFGLIKNHLTKKGKLLLTFHHSDMNLILDFLKTFKMLKFNLDAIYPVFGESSGKLMKRKLYIDLLFIFSLEKKETYYVPTNVYITEEDKKLINFIEKIERWYNEF